MALLPCRDCGHDCSNKALACPQCGRMIRSRGWWATTIGWGVIMSAMLSFMLALLVGFLFYAVLGIAPRF